MILGLEFTIEQMVFILTNGIFTGFAVGIGSYMANKLTKDNIEPRFKKLKNDNKEKEKEIRKKYNEIIENEIKEIYK